MSAIKRLCWFLLGVAVGILGLSFYELFGKPVLPFDGKYDVGLCDFDKSVYIKPKSTKKILIKFKNVGKGKPPTYNFDSPVKKVKPLPDTSYYNPVTATELPEKIYVHTDATYPVKTRSQSEPDKADTQPVRVVDVSGDYCTHKALCSTLRRPAWYYCPACGSYLDINYKRLELGGTVWCEYEPALEDTQPVKVG